MAKVLIIEDDDVIARGMARHPGRLRVSTPWAWPTERRVWRASATGGPTCVLDLMLPGIDGWRA
jgi:DNA-binding response OmpR family regulator